MAKQIRMLSPTLRKFEYKDTHIEKLKRSGNKILGMEDMGDHIYVYVLKKDNMYRVYTIYKYKRKRQCINLGGFDKNKVDKLVETNNTEDVKKLSRIETVYYVIKKYPKSNKHAIYKRLEEMRGTKDMKWKRASLQILLTEGYILSCLSDNNRNIAQGFIAN